MKSDGTTIETLAGLTLTQTMTNKTLTSPTINNGTITGARMVNNYWDLYNRTPIQMPPSYANSNGAFWFDRITEGSAAVAQDDQEIDLSTGATSGSGCGIKFSIPQTVTGNKAFEIGFVVLTGASVANLEIEIGVTSESGGDLSTSADHHITLRYNSASSNKWILANANGTTETTTTTALADVAAATAYYIVIANKESSVEFYVNGASAGAAHTTNLPTTTAMSPTVFINNSSAADRTLSYKHGWFLGDWS